MNRHTLYSKGYACLLLSGFCFLFTNCPASFKIFTNALLTFHDIFKQVINALPTAANTVFRIRV